MEFEESMRATSMSFFKTAKSTFMSTNDIQSNSIADSYHAWGDQSSAVPVRDARGEDEKSLEGSDLGADAEHILAGGSMSILRRKGKQFRDRREKREGGRGAQL